MQKFLRGVELLPAKAEPDPLSDELWRGNHTAHKERRRRQLGAAADFAGVRCV
jgi:hypothetical protein